MSEPITSEATTASVTSETKRKSRKEASKAKAKPVATSRNGDLGTPQMRILKALSKAKGPITRNLINEMCAKAGYATAEKFSAWMTNPLGQLDPKARKAAEAKSGYKSLLTLGYAKHVDLEVDGHKESCFQITAAGTKALAKV